MLFTPDNKLDIISEQDFPAAICEIEAELAKYRTEGYFTTSDKKQLYYEYYLARDSKGTIVIVHGLSEFTKKFYEVTYYFLKMGYNLFLYDQRGHGLSHRDTPRPEIIYFNTFYRLAKDLEEFIDSVVLANSDKPLYIYSHSMGGAVTAIYLAKNSQKITKAIMSAPLIEPYVRPVSPFVAYSYARTFSIFVGKTQKFTFTDEFNPNQSCKVDDAISATRFEHHIKMRRENRNYQSTPMSFGCVCELLTVRRKLLKKKIAGRITTPVLLISSEKDTVVKNTAQQAFAERCDACELVTIKNASHAMLGGNNEIIAEHIKKVFDFYSC